MPPHTELNDEDANRAPDDGIIRAPDDGIIRATDDEAIGDADDEANRAVNDGATCATDDGAIRAAEATNIASEGSASNQLEARPSAAVPPAEHAPADFMATSVECCATNFYPGKFRVGRTTLSYNHVLRF